MINIKLEKSCCTGCGACAAVCPDNWKIDSDKAVCLNPKPDEIGCNKEAADSCPNECIKIIE